MENELTGPSEPQKQGSAAESAVEAGKRAAPAVVSIGATGTFIKYGAPWWIDWWIRGDFVKNEIGPVVVLMWDHPIWVFFAFALFAFAVSLLGVVRGVPTVSQRFPHKHWAVLMFALTAIAIVAPEVPEITPGRLEVEIIQARAPMAYRPGTEPSVPGVGYVVRIGNAGGESVGIDAMRVRFYPSGMGMVPARECPGVREGSGYMRIATGQAGGPDYLYSDSLLLVHQVGARVFEPGDNAHFIVACTLENPNLIPTIITSYTTHMVQIVDQAGNMVSASLLWPALAVPERLEGTWFEVRADSVITP